MINDTIKNIQGLYGKKMSGYFEGMINKPLKTEIDICTILEALKDYELDDININIDDLDDAGIIKEISSNNSYNWCSPVSNHFYYHVYDTVDGVLVDLAVHCGYTDVRCGYYDDIYLKFNSYDEFLEVVSMAGVKYLSICINDKSYTVRVDVFSDMIEVSDDNDNKDLDYDDAEKVIDYINEHEKECYILS